jgi:hypothetical protein
VTPQQAVASVEVCLKGSIATIRLGDSTARVSIAKDRLDAYVQAPAKWSTGKTVEGLGGVFSKTAANDNSLVEQFETCGGGGNNFLVLGVVFLSWLACIFDSSADSLLHFINFMCWGEWVGGGC